MERDLPNFSIEDIKTKLKPPKKQEQPKVIEEKKVDFYEFAGQLIRQQRVAGRYGIAEALGHEYGNKVTGIYLDNYDLEVIDEMNDKLCR